MKRISDYTESDFIAFMKEIFIENEAETDDRLDILLDEFRKLTEYPAGTDLIYYAESDADCTPERVTLIVKEWRAANGLPGFKE